MSRSTGQLGLARVTPLTLNWARTPLTKIASCDYQFNGAATSPEGVMTYYSGTYPDGTGTLYADVSRYKMHPIFMVDTNTASTSYNVALATDYYVEA